MVDVRDKGKRGELAARDTLRHYTGLNFQRTPGSGSLGADKGLKGDLYIPQEKNTYTIEVKFYKDDAMCSNILKNTTNNIRVWWSQAVRQAKQNNNKPMLLYKFNRSKWFIVINEPKILTYDVNFIYMRIEKDNLIIALLDDIMDLGILEFLNK